MIDPSLRRTVKRKYKTLRRVGFSGVVGKYWNWVLLHMTAPDSIGTKREDGFRFHFFRGARFQPPEVYSKMGIETFDVALNLEGNLAVDIGAHIGAYSMRLAQKFRHVYAFEPNPEVYRILAQNIKENSITNIDAEQIAISDKSGTATMRVSSKFLAAGTIAKKHYDWLSWDGTIGVREESLDNYFRNRIGKIDYVKIDVEGHELAVLKGMINVIRKHHPMMSVEVHQRQTSPASCDCNVCGWLKEQGLAVELHGKYIPENDAHWLVVT